MAAFKPEADADFERRLAAYFREEHAGTIVQLASGPTKVEELQEDVLVRMVRTGIARARSYGLSFESSIAGFLTIMFETAPGFDSHPLLKRLLSDPEVLPNSRVDHLLRRATEENWNVVRRSYDPNAWGLDERRA
jgi:hypothetical protein